MKTAKLKMSDGKTKGCGVLSLQGNLSLDNIEQVVHFFREAVGKYKRLSVELKEVNAIDLGFLQLLWSLENDMHEKWEGLEVKMVLPGELEQLLRNTGFSRWLGSAASATKQ